MRTSVLSDNFARAVKIAAYAVAKKPRLQVLGNVLLSADDIHLTVSATNLEVSISYRIGAKTDVLGAITVPPTVAEPDSWERLDLELDAKTQILHCSTPTYVQGPKGRTRTVKGIQASEFPVVPAFDRIDKPVVVLPNSRDLKRAIKYVCEVEAASKHLPDPVIFVKAQSSRDGRGPDTVTLTASNGHETHRATLKASVLCDYEIALSRDVLNVLCKAMVDKTEVSVYDCGSERNQVALAWEDSFKDSDSGRKFPNHGSVEMIVQTIDTAKSAATLPDNYFFAVELFPAELDRAVKRAGIFSKACTLKIEHVATDKGKAAAFSVVGESEELGDVTSRPDIGYTLLPPVRALRFNCGKLRDVLQAMAKIAKDDTVTLRLSGERAPILIEAHDEGLSLAAAVMPLAAVGAYICGRAWADLHDWQREQDNREALKAYADWKAANLPLESRVAEDERRDALQTLSQYRGVYSSYDVVEVYEYLYAFGDVPKHRRKPLEQAA